MQCVAALYLGRLNTAGGYLGRLNTAGGITAA